VSLSGDPFFPPMRVAPPKPSRPLGNVTYRCDGQAIACTGRAVILSLHTRSAGAQSVSLVESRLIDNIRPAGAASVLDLGGLQGFSMQMYRYSSNQPGCRPG
jgi:hypothetical protein